MARGVSFNLFSLKSYSLQLKSKNNIGKRRSKSIKFDYVCCSTFPPLNFASLSPHQGRVRLCRWLDFHPLPTNHQSRVICLEGLPYTAARNTEPIGTSVHPCLMQGSHLLCKQYSPVSRFGAELLQGFVSRLDIISIQMTPNIFSKTYNIPLLVSPQNSSLA